MSSFTAQTIYFGSAPLNTTQIGELDISSRATAQGTLSQTELEATSDSDDDVFGGVPLMQTLNFETESSHAIRSISNRSANVTQTEASYFLQGLSSLTRSTQPTTEADLDDRSSDTDIDILLGDAFAGECEGTGEMALVGADEDLSNQPDLPDINSPPHPHLLEWIPMPLDARSELLSDSMEFPTIPYLRPSIIPPNDIYFSYSQEARAGTSLALGLEAGLQRDQFSHEMWSTTSMEEIDFMTLSQMRQIPEPDMEERMEDFEDNMKVVEFFEFWRARYAEGFEFPPIGKDAMALELERNINLPDEIATKDLDGDRCDIQGINWAKLGARRKDARNVRNQLYRTYRNIPWEGRMESPKSVSQRLSLRGRTLRDLDESFRFERFMTQHKAKLCQFQLRHLLAAPSRNAVFYATAEGVVCANTTLKTRERVMDFTQKANTRYVSAPTRISTLTAAHGVLAVGGYNGEYALKSLYTPNDGHYVSGMLTYVSNSITNHVHIFLGRRSGLPQAVFCSNDDYIRTIDCNTNTEVQSHRIPWPSNCSATSPDNRLRLVVGDDIESLILDAETGRRVTGLRHHRDYGFACDWSPDGRYMATGNQDETVQIWDARHWNYPLYTEIPFDKTIGTELGGIRSLHFSPLGGGKPVLLMAEPADVISIVDATTFDTRQRFDFFGEIGGTSFVPDGSAFFVANMDRTFGGLFQFERTTWQEPNHDRPFEPS